MYPSQFEMTVLATRQQAQVIREDPVLGRLGDGDAGARRCRLGRALSASTHAVAASTHASHVGARPEMGAAMAAAADVGPGAPA